MSKSVAYSALAIVAAAGLTFGAFMIPKNESAEAATTDKATGMSKAEIEQIIKDYILANPEVLMQSVNEYQSKMARDRQNQAQKLIPEVLPVLTAKDMPSYGNPNGDVTIIEFFDYNCGYCKRALPAIEEMNKKDKNLRFVFAELPILSPQSQVAARAAMAVHLLDSSKYFAYHSKLMKHNGNKDEATLLKLAEEVGLKKDDVAAKMKDKAVDEKLAKVQEAAQKIGVGGTPSFIVGTQFVPGAIDAASMLKMVEVERKNKKK